MLHFASAQYARQLTPNMNPFANSTWPAAVKMLEHFGKLENGDSLSTQAFANSVRGMLDGGLINPASTSHLLGAIVL